MSDGWRSDRRVAEVLDEADVLYVAVAARRGHHVTPAVFDHDGGQPTCCSGGTPRPAPLPT